MLFFEIKKIFARTSNRIALLLLPATLLLACFLAIDNNYYVNEYGETETGFTAIQKLKAEKQKWAGELTTEKLAAVLEENMRIIATEEYQSDDITMKNIAFSYIQGISDIRDMISRAFGQFREWDYYKANSLTPSDADKFYTNRISQVETWLNSEGDGADSFTDAEKAFILNQYKTLETPFYYECTDGWQAFFEFFTYISMIPMLILAFLVTRIFSAEAALKTDAILFSSYHGRKRAVIAKIGAGIVLVTAVYFIMVFAYAAVLFGFFGTEGAHLAIQINMSGWKSLCHLTNIQEFRLIIAGGYIGCLFFSLLVMLVSAKTKNSVLAVLVPFVLLFLRSFIMADRLSLLGRIMELFPDQLLQVNEVISAFSICDIGGTVILSHKILLVLYPLLIILLIPLLYRVYSKTQVA